MSHFHYEFGIITHRNHETGSTRVGTLVLDLRHISAFCHIRDHKGPENKMYPSVTEIQCHNSNIGIIFYPYKEFKKLYESVMNVQVQSLAYPQIP